MSHHCEVLIFQCIDFRFQTFIRTFLVKKLNLDNSYDLVSVAGGVRDFVRDERNIPLASLLKQIEISTRLHGVTKIILINHQNCGAYGQSLESGSEDELKTHSHDLQSARNVILREFPQLSVACYFAKLNGELMEI